MTFSLALAYISFNEARLNRCAFVHHPPKISQESYVRSGRISNIGGNVRGVLWQVLLYLIEEIYIRR